MRIALRDLDELAHHINSKMGTLFVVELFHGKVRMSQYLGARDVLSTGFTSKSNLYRMMNAFLTGATISPMRHQICQDCQTPVTPETPTFVDDEGEFYSCTKCGGTFDVEEPLDKPPTAS